MKQCTAMPTSRAGQCWFLLPIALVLLAGGCAALVLLGLPAVQQYAIERHFRSSDCRVIAVRYTGNRSCKSSPSPTFYPCIIVVASYNEVDAKEIHGPGDVSNNSSRHVVERAAVLYKSAADKVQTTVDVDDVTNVYYNSTCSIRACSQSSFIENSVDVRNFLVTLGFTSTSLSAFPSSIDADDAVTARTSISFPVTRCYVDLASWDSNGYLEDPTLESSLLPWRRRKAFIDVVTGDRVVHTLWWPSLAIGSGIFLCVVAVCQLCFEARLCRRRCSSFRDDERHRKQRRGTSTDLPEVVGGAKSSIVGIPYSSSACSTCSTCERATLTTGTSSSSSGTNSSRRSKSLRSSASNRSLLPVSSTSTSRSTKSSAGTETTEKTCHHCDVHGNTKYASNTV